MKKDNKQIWIGIFGQVFYNMFKTYIQVKIKLIMFYK